MIKLLSGFFRQGGHVMKRQIDQLLQSLMLIRLGQELGSDSPAARLVYEWISLVISAVRFLG